MNLEPIIQSEASQEEKSRYCILTHIYGIQKNGTDEPKEWTCDHSGERRGWDELRR